MSSICYSLYQLLIDPPNADDFNAHIKLYILTFTEKYSNNYHVDFVGMIQNVMRSNLIWDKQFLCLLWYITSPVYQKLVNQNETNKLRISKFTPILYNKLDWFIGGVQISNNATTKNYDLKNEPDMKFTHTIGYLISECIKEYILL